MSETVGLTQGLAGQLGPGRVIAGKYRLEAEIGRGSMGTVFRAVHVTLGQRVAIKLISTEHSQSDEARKRFSVEAKAAAKLRSRHVVQVYDDGETPEGNPYIVLEYLEGETLEQRLERDRDIALVDATRVVSHVGRALARAHAQGIVHRDLKPANIFLVKTEDDDVGWLAKVLDFGIAKLDSATDKATTQAGTVLGTPLFMSPEQVRGASSVDHRADLYSLGMCFYHMLTGEFAYYSSNYSDILVAICTQPLPSLRAKAPWVPESVELWFERACAKEPLERFQSADEMTEALQAASGSGTLSRHSFAEGRIAPETLVGFAAPPSLTQLADHGAASLAHTQLLAPPIAGAATSPGFGGAAAGDRPVAPVAISVGSGDARELSGAYSVPKLRMAPLVIGVGLGLLAITTVALTLLMLSGSGAKPSVATSSAAPAASPAPAPLLPPTSDPPRALPEPAAVPVAPPVSSVTAEKPTESRLKAQKAKTSNGPRAPSRPASGSAPAVQKPAGSDLGF